MLKFMIEISWVLVSVVFSYGVGNIKLVLLIDSLY